MKSLRLRLTLGGTLLMLTAFLFTARPAFADTPTPTPTPKCGKTDVACVIQFGDTEISKRLASLQTLGSKASANKYLTAGQKSTIANDVTTNTSGLNTLKATIDAEKDAQAARKDVESIFSTFRIYAIVLPRDYDEIYLFHQQNVLALEAAAVQNLKNFVTSSSPADVQQKYADMQTQVTNATTETGNAQTAIATLTPAAFNANHAAVDATFKSIHDELHRGESDLRKAGEDLRYIVAKLGGGTVADPAATVTP